jgi:hypothetical protein
MRVGIKILVPIWGTRYVDMFLTSGLPSMLSARNLPILASEYRCEFVVLTNSKGEAHIRSHPAFERLALLCPVRFIAIDDLIIRGMEGYSLTLAFARGVQDSGPKMVDTYFLFMNADFVVSDGAFETLLRHIREGRRAIMAPSLRCTAEDAYPVLRERINPSDQTLTLSPREMVRMTLDHLHATASANLVGGNIAFNSATNQFFWWVDRHTMLGRFFLLFMLCIRPERELKDVSGLSAIPMSVF